MCEGDRLFEASEVKDVCERLSRGAGVVRRPRPGQGQLFEEWEKLGLPSLFDEENDDECK